MVVLLLGPAIGGACDAPSVLLCEFLAATDKQKFFQSSSALRPRVLRELVFCEQIVRTGAAGEKQLVDRRPDVGMS
jgi:hypothetical protein